jgi:hypothetical protein
LSAKDRNLEDWQRRGPIPAVALAFLAVLSYLVETGKTSSWPRISGQPVAQCGIKSNGAGFGPFLLPPIGFSLLHVDSLAVRVERSVDSDFLSFVGLH